MRNEAPATPLPTAYWKRLAEGVYEAGMVETIIRKVSTGYKRTLKYLPCQVFATQEEAEAYVIGAPVAPAAVQPHSYVARLSSKSGSIES